MQMNIAELSPKQGNVNIIVEVVDVGEVREFVKFGRPGRVANATVKDESGQIMLTLWNEQIDQVKAGDKVKVTNGYVREWQGEKQLTTGRLGSLEVTNEEEEEEDFGGEDAEEDLEDEGEEKEKEEE
jgi:replication factor A1